MALSSVSPLHRLLTRRHHVLPFGDVHEHLRRPESARFLKTLLPPLQDRHVHPTRQPFSVPLVMELLLSFVKLFLRSELLHAESCITGEYVPVELLAMLIHLLLDTAHGEI